MNRFLHLLAYIVFALALTPALAQETFPGRPIFSRASWRRG